MSPSNNNNEQTDYYEKMWREGLARKAKADEEKAAQEKFAQDSKEEVLRYCEESIFRMSITGNYQRSDIIKAYLERVDNPRQKALELMVESMKDPVFGLYQSPDTSFYRYLGETYKSTKELSLKLIEVFGKNFDTDVWINPLVNFSLTGKEVESKFFQALVERIDQVSQPVKFNRDLLTTNDLFLLGGLSGELFEPGCLGAPGDQGGIQL